MRRKTLTLRLGMAVLMAMALTLTAAKTGMIGHAATPATGTIDGSAPVAWDFGAVVGGTVVNQDMQRTCPPGMCDNYDLTVNLPADAATYYTTKTASLVVKYTWSSTAPTDLDVFAFSPNGTEFGPGSPDVTSTGPGEEDLTITDPAPGVWHIRSAGSVTAVPTAAHAVATLTFADRVAPPSPTPNPTDPTFANYEAPAPLGQKAGEPSLGVNPATGSVMYVTAGCITCFPLTARIKFDDSTTPATASWTDVSATQENKVTADPIGFMDARTGRFFASQLYAACSITAYTDDDGNNWSPSQGCGVPSGADHQTIGGGPYAPGSLVGPLTPYPDAVYYCSQDIATAFCARSDNGGISFGPGIPLYNLTQCGGIHGHVKVAPDGTVYVPNRACQDAQGKTHPAVAVSTDSGQHWYVSTVPDGSSKGQGSDPSVAIGPNNSVYLGYQNGNGHAMIAVSRDRGATWSKSVDVGTPWGIQNTEFAEVTVGDDNRAAFAFLGTPTAGDDQSAGFAGTWNMYVAYTFDGGKTWTTVNATPGNPVQRGCIWDGGGSNPCRNLSDFNDATIDKHGRVLIAYTDGCIGACETDPSQAAFSRVAAILRQTGGKGLLAAYDGTF